MKRIIGLLIMLMAGVFMLGGTKASAEATTDKAYGDFTYRIETDSDYTLGKTHIDGEPYVIITGLINDTVTDIVIPETIEGIPVAKIGKEAFCKKNIKSVSMSDNILSIGKSAFGLCESLSNIKLSQSLAYIEQWAFRYCSSLSEIKLPDSLEGIAAYAFIQSGIKQIAIPTKIKWVSKYTFQDCKSLKKIELPKDLVGIEEYAFNKCTSLIDIELPSNIKRINAFAFTLCESLKEINLPDSIEVIEKCAFANCSSLNNIQLPKYLKILEDGVFGYCSNLTNIDLNENLETMRGSSLINCPIKNLYIPKSVLEIGNECVYRNENINVTLCGICYGNTQLESITVDPDNLNFISENGILYTRDKTQLIKYPAQKKDNSFIIPEGVFYLGGRSFANNQYLQTLILPKSLIWLEGLNECQNISTINLPQGLKFIGNYTFYNCVKLEDINLPNSLIAIGEAAFSNTMINTITIPDGIKFIEKDTFDTCQYLSYISIPSTIEAIGINAFSDCNNLSKVDYLCTTWDNIKIYEGNEPLIFAIRNGISINESKTATPDPNAINKVSPTNAPPLSFLMDILNIKTDNSQLTTPTVTSSPDTKKPAVKGVKNGKTYKKAVKITFTDESGIKKATLNGKKIKCGKKVSKNGKYTLIVIDKAKNKRTIKFRIKKKSKVKSGTFSI